MFISEPTTPDASAFLAHEKAATGYVMNTERAWAWRPDVATIFTAMRQQLADRSGLSPREVASLVCTTARTVGDSYCSLAWGARLAKLATPALAAAVLKDGDAAGLSPRERALARWTEQVVRDPNGSTQEQVDRLREAGLSDREIFEATAFIALRMALSTVNDALGARPDRELADAAPPEVRAAVTYGRPTAT
jgi:uncharacterized peroxidase-related enzyme